MKEGKTGENAGRKVLKGSGVCQPPNPTSSTAKTMREVLGGQEERKAYSEWEGEGKGSGSGMGGRE